MNETKASSSPVPSNFIMALYGITHGAHCWLKKWKKINVHTKNIEIIILSFETLNEYSYS